MTIKRETTVTVKTIEKIREYSFHLCSVNEEPPDLRIARLHRRDINLDYKQLKALRQFLNNLDEFENKEERECL